jgi:hypothetical protein
LLPVGVGVFFFVACLFLYTRNNTFTFKYHPDEQSKTRQIIEGTRNFNHPQLMLETTHLVVRLLGVAPKPQSVVEVGRWVSAGFAAMAVVALAATGYRAAGAAGMLAVGAVVGLCPSLLVYAHYFKEDAALVLGVSLVVLASHWAWHEDRPRWRAGAVAAAGAACGLAASAKYFGATAVLLALPALIVPPRRGAAARVAVFALVLVATFFVVNHRAAMELAAFGDSFARQAELSVANNDGLTMSRPNAYAAGVVLRGSVPHVALFVIVAALLWATSWRRHGWELSVLGFMLVLLVLLSFGVLLSDRYALPVVVLAHFVGALGVAMLINRPMRWPWRAVLVGAVGLGALAWQLPRCMSFLGQFADDSRARLRAWAVEALPWGTAVLQDDYCGLRYPDARGGEPVAPLEHLDIRTAGFAADAGSLEALREQGVAYVVICDLAYGRYLHPQVIPSPGSEDEYHRRRSWYERLIREHEPVWESVPHPPMGAQTNPTIRVYRIDATRAENHPAATLPSSP